MDFHKTLLNWYLLNSRSLPWRETSNPYNIWLSEIMLQQTRIAQGLPYYEKFIAHFPTVFDLANAKEEHVLKLWQGLGYYSRARNLHFTAKYVAEELNGIFPDNYKDLKKLKGVGDYTAAAIASICYDEPVAVVDGNVYRVLARYFGVETPINSTEGVKQFKALAQEMLYKKDPKHYNQALMEFGALHCKPKNPLCESCPFQKNCVAFQQGKTASLPVKLKKTKVTTRHFNYLVFKKNDETLLQKRTGKGIWKNLYEFPLLETSEEIQKEAFTNHPEVEKLVGKNFKNIRLYNNKPIKHVLSHQKLFAKFWIISVEDFPVAFEKPIIATQFSTIETFAVPVLLEKFIEAFHFSK
ncbi:A/G-specific adenine glycosylase [Mesonia maritima]|uniref:Adenine DNA glycosylase n=1 Tax=Mesonia maritima TaxID=1793873 RepID=A0ABU1K4V3_9FLAO|nr:A/G-specific adenine glycosylase [Mesonia maritima]MDR6299552.1 A/G-specific adenine glycosylase [Mesonia maritima]